MKDVYYFAHDFEASNDPKIMALLSEFGATGYGIWWRVVEMLHSEQDHKILKKPFVMIALAKQLQVEKPLIEKLLTYACEVCELLQEDETSYWSERVLRNIEKRDEKKNKRTQAAVRAGKASAQKRLNANSTHQSDNEQEVNARSTDVEQPLSKSNQRKGKEIKGKEIKGNLIQIQGEAASPVCEKAKIDFELFISEWNQVYGTSIRLTKSKKTQVINRLKTFSPEEIIYAMHKRRHDHWLNNDGKKFLTDWEALFRNDEKIEKYLNAPLKHLQHESTKRSYQTSGDHIGSLYRDIANGN